MTFAARMHQPTGGNALAPLNILHANAYTLPDTSSVTFGSNGTISYLNEQVSGAFTWYGSTVAGIGASYEIRFTYVSGTAWDTGLVSGTWYSLSSNRAVALSSSSGDKESTITVDIRLASTGEVVTTGTVLLGTYIEP